MSKLVYIESEVHFAQLLNSSRVVVADFYADWCGPCKAIAPVYEALATQLSRPRRITFTKVDVDAQKELARAYNVSAMPTFIIFKAGRETKRIRGADPKGLDAAVKALAQEAQTGDEDAAAAAASGSSSGGGAGGSWTGASAPRSYGEVSEQIDIQGLDFLNLDGEAGGKRVVFSHDQPSALAGSKGSSKDWIESDTDEQLMLYIPFQSTLKLHSLHITSVPAAAEEEETVMRPQTIRLYTNRSHVLGFDEAEDTPAVQEIAIQESDWDPKTHTAKVELRFVKFQNISSVVLFVVDGNGDAEKTRIDRIRLFGETGEKRAMGKLEKIGDDAGE